MPHDIPNYPNQQPHERQADDDAQNDHAGHYNEHYGPDAYAASDDYTIAEERSEPAPARIGQQYRTALGGDIMRMDDERRDVAQVVARLQPKLQATYELFPALHPESIEAMRLADRMYLGYIALGAGTTQVTLPSVAPEDAAVRLVEYGARSREEVQELAAAVAAVSLRQTVNAFSREHYERLRRSHAVRRDVAQYVRANATFLQRGSVAGLDNYYLRQAGMDADDVAALRRATQLGSPELPQLDAPPVHLTQLVVDMMNHKRSSITAPAAMHRRFSQQHAVALSPNDENVIIGLYKQYLGRRYGLPERPQGQLGAILAECDLAERQGFWLASPDAQSRTAQRTRDLFQSFTDDRQLPDSARQLVVRCRTLSV